jgi:hypothetical protein
LNNYFYCPTNVHISPIVNRTEKFLLKFKNLGGTKKAFN